MLEKGMALLKGGGADLEAWDPFREFRFPMPALPKTWMPRVDIRETDKEYLLTVALPGVRKEDLKVEVKDDILTISGERKAEKEEKGRAWLRKETEYGVFLRSFELPEGIHSEDVHASCKDGVLSVTLRKPAEVKSRGVSVKVD